MIQLLLAIICMCGPVNGPTSGPYAPAQRLDPPVVVATAPPPMPVLFTTDAVGSSCEGARFLVMHFSPGWNVDRVLRWMHRESRCDPTAMNTSSSASGLLQILASTHCPWIRREFGDCSRQWLADPVNNIRAAASLWDKQGDSAWNL